MISETARLYISPFNTTLEQFILNPVQRAAIHNKSFHTIQTFPDRSFGYFDIAAEEATELRRKFNGSIFKGMKLRVEEARPAKRKSRDTSEGSPVPLRESKSRKREEGVLQGVELPLQRAIKRGWVPDQSRMKGSRLSAEQKQLVFRTTVPANVASVRHSSPKGRAKRSARLSKTIELKEFSNTTKFPGFLRDSNIAYDAKPASEYVEGSGWVDEDGNVIEKQISWARTRGKTQAETIENEIKSPRQYHSRNIENLSAERQADLSLPSPLVSSSSPEEMSDTLIRQGEHEQVLVTKTKKIVSPNSKMHRKRTSMTPDITLTRDKSNRIHPLESLFKQPAPTSNPKAATPAGLAPINTSFSFFDEDIERDDNGFSNMPQTPFTRRDIEGRRIRSAAPTPDTAAIGKRFAVPWKRRSVSVEASGGGQDTGELPDEDETTIKEMARATRGRDVIGEGTKEGTEWEKHFWEHRGDYNRSWKARRREARNESRQSINRRTKR